MFTITPKPKHGELDWLMSRWRDADGRCVFGASDVPVLMGVSPWRTRADLYLDKTTTPTVKEETDAMERGNLLEAPLLIKASRVLGVEITTPSCQYRKGRLVVSLDGVPADEHDAPTLIVEAKTSASHTVETADDLPAEWRWQGWAQSEVLGGIPVFFVVLDRRQRMSVVQLQDSPEARERLMLELDAFGDRVDRGEPLGDLVNMLDAETIGSVFKAKDEQVELGHDGSRWVDLLAVAREQRLDAERMEKQAKDELARLMQHANVGVFNGQPLVSWKETAGRDSFDGKTFRQHHPDLYAQFTKKGASFRTMRLLNQKGEE
jgi:predicted phage-related endonuclease